MQKLVENEKNLKEIDFDSNPYDNCVYIYVGKSSSKLHFFGPEICDKIPAGCNIRIRYLHENYLFLTAINDKNSGNKVSNASAANSKDPYHNCVHIQHIVDRLGMEPLTPKSAKSNHSGVRKGIDPYMYKGEIGYIINIEEFKPKI